MERLEDVEAFWRDCRAVITGLPEAIPEAWRFGATAGHANDLLNLVLVGKKTATASSLWDYAQSGDPIPTTGQLSIVCDGRGTPRALLETVDVEVVPFHQVSASHAFAEGEGDRSLAYWRGVHERFWREHSENPRGFELSMPVVCERFRLVYATGEGL